MGSCQGLGQLAPVRLAVEIHQEALQEGEFPGDHVRGQAFGQLDFQLGGELEVRARGPLIEDHEGGERIDGPLLDHRQDDGIADPRQSPQVRLDVRQLDPVSVQLDLVVDPALEEEQAVAVAAPVARPVSPMAIQAANAFSTRSGRLRYPGLTLGPAMMISPRSPAAASRPCSSITTTRVPGIGCPIGSAANRSRIARVIRIEVVATVASVGP